MGHELWLAGVLGTVLVMYVLTGGADFGGGVLDMVASGPRKVEQRRTIALVLGPIWEANHVWLILAIVLTFVGLPDAFAAISIALHVPLVVMLFGIVLRGAGLVFRKYDSRRAEVQAGWSRWFGLGSVLAPFMLGVSVGTIASGQIRAAAAHEAAGAWLSPFPLAVGALTVAICTYLAAVYLTVATREDPGLQQIFRARGISASIAVFCLAWLAFFLARTGAPRVWSGLWESAYAMPFQVLVAVVGLGTMGALYASRFQLARVLAMTQVVLVIGGWAMAQYPYVVVPDVTVADTAPEGVVWSMLTVLAVGAAPLAAAYGWMVWVFRGGDAPIDHRVPRPDGQR